MKRIEKDTLGEMEIPREVYWGIHTERALHNFKVSGGGKTPFVLIQALAVVKKAACLANQELGYLSRPVAEAVKQACEEVLQGRFQDSFPLEALQGGAGTSTNMNVNEVAANRALEILGRAKGDYAVIHPIEHVNLHQSTNDVYPTALKVAVLWELKKLSESIARLQGVFQSKEKEFAAIVKMGRTELQSAVPMTLGAEFGAFAEAFGRDRWRVFKCEERIRQVNLGGTAVGTGLCAPSKYIFLVIEKLREITGLPLAAAENRVDLTANTDAFAEVSGILKAYALNLIKVAEDLRKLNLLREIALPQVQAGSSIMPGKVNPVILESVIQAGLKSLACDFLISEAVSRSTFQINEWMPLLASSILEMPGLLKNASEMFAGHAEGICACAQTCEARFARSEEIITAFVPVLGYEACTNLLKEYRLGSFSNLKDFLIQKLGKEKVGAVLSPEALLQLGFKDHGKNT